MLEWGSFSLLVLSQRCCERAVASSVCVLVSVRFTQSDLGLACSSASYNMFCEGSTRWQVSV